MTLLHMTYNITLSFIDGTSEYRPDQHMTFETNWPHDWLVLQDYVEQLEKAAVAEVPNCIRAVVPLDYSYTLETRDDSGALSS